MQTPEDAQAMLTVVAGLGRQATRGGMAALATTLRAGRRQHRSSARPKASFRVRELSRQLHSDASWLAGSVNLPAAPRFQVSATVFHGAGWSRHPKVALLSGRKSGIAGRQEPR